MTILGKEIKAVIFDMDGVLVDSEQVISKAAIEGLREYGIEASPEDFVPYIGTGENSYIGNVVRLHGGTYSEDMKTRIYEIYCANAERDLIRFPDVPETVSELRRRGLKLAVASSADKVKVDANMKAARIDPDCFGAVITGCDIEKLKPAPDIFLAAARKLSVRPEECIVCEDAKNGVTAAKAGGMMCLGITSSFPAETLSGLGADITSDNIKILLQYA